MDIGWQSWSPVSSHTLKLPIRNYSPFGLQSESLNHVKPFKNKPITGWCSWHTVGRNITESYIVDHVRFIKNKKLPLTYILVDDGWTLWGDWLHADAKKFPGGMRDLAQKILHAGFLPGIWMAPFLCDPNALICTKHPSWFVRSEDGTLIEGRKVTRFDRFLPIKRWIFDLTKPEVRTYILESIDTLITTFGFRLLKLDFLYAQHFNPIFKTHHEPDRLLRSFLATIKKRYPHVFIAASGSPLIPAIGVVDSMRISEDIVNPQLHGIWPWNRIIHTKRLNRLMENIKIRFFTKKWWTLDTDAFVCHPNFGFSTDQIRIFRDAIIHSNGIKFLGDNLLQLDKKLWPTIEPLLRGM